MVMAVVAGLALAGCGGSGSGPLTGAGTGTSTGTGTGTGTTTTTTYSMGNGSGGSFQSGMIGISSTSVSAGGTTSLQVSIVDQTGALYTAASVTVTFSSTCISQGLAAVTASGSSSAGTNANTVVTTSGTVSATYTAKGCSGADVITASATVASTSLTATGTVTVATAATGSIQFESATPTTIGLKGTGQTSTSTVVFKVLDATGAPKRGVTVNFALDSTVGGLSLTPSSATSAADGTVQTEVSSGTVHTAVKVTASIASPALSTQSSELTVTTGIPASASFSMATGPAKYPNGGASNPPACANVEGYDTDGVVVPLTVRLSDRYGNPVLDGTAVSFYTNGGQVVGSCTTSGGACEADWTSSNPRPQTNSDSPPLVANGRVTVLATAIGEESFTDTNGDGFWESGEPFEDLGEPYDDANQNNQYDSGEYFLDYNHNAKWDGPSGSFVGITCTGTDANSTCTTKTLAIEASHLIVMSTAEAVIACDPVAECNGTGGFGVNAGQTATFTFNVQDANGNPVAAGTTISVTASSGIGTITTGSSFTIGCSGDLHGDDYMAYLSVPAGATSGTTGTITIQATSPGTKTITSPTIVTVTVN
jgi:hypothetical protein